MSNLFKLEYVPHKKLLKILVSKVDAQLFKAAHTHAHTSSARSSFNIF